MSRNLNIIAAAALALTLALTGQAMAQLRVVPGPAGVMDICTGHGSVRVLAGPDGTPLDTAHVCPDCVMMALGDVCLPQATAPYLPRMSRLAVQRVTAHATSLAGVRPSARSPPGAG